MTSAAEAKLDARIRPDITAMRSRTSYPRRHRPPLAVIAGGGDAGAAAGGAATAESSEQFARSSGTQTFARTVSTERITWRVARTERTVTARAAARTTRAVPSVLAGARPARATSASAPVRLTRRGRIVVGVLITMAVAAMTALIWLAVAGQAEAASHVRPGGPVGHSMLRVVVRPGQTLWGIATKTDPAADPRAVIQEIIDDNALAGTAVQAGQVLWVPRG
jgi:nucleoid-associated protein YgaU